MWGGLCYLFYHLSANKWMSFLAVYKRFTQMLKDFVIWKAWFYSTEDVAESHAFLNT